MADYTLSVDITGKSSGLDKAISAADKAVSSFEKKMGSLSKTLTSVGQKMTSAGKKIMAVEAAFGGVAAIGVKYNATMENYATSFEVMTGSAEKAAEKATKEADRKLYQKGTSVADIADVLSVTEQEVKQWLDIAP